MNQRRHKGPPNRDPKTQKRLRASYAQFTLISERPRPRHGPEISCVGSSVVYYTIHGRPYSENPGERVAVSLHITQQISLGIVPSRVPGTPREQRKQRKRRPGDATRAASCRKSVHHCVPAQQFHVFAILCIRHARTETHTVREG